MTPIFLFFLSFLFYTKNGWNRHFLQYRHRSMDIPSPSLWVRQQNWSQSSICLSNFPDDNAVVQFWISSKVYTNSPTCVSVCLCVAVKMSFQSSQSVDSVCVHLWQIHSLGIWECCTCRGLYLCIGYSARLVCGRCFNAQALSMCNASVLLFSGIYCLLIQPFLNKKERTKLYSLLTQNF